MHECVCVCVCVQGRNFLSTRLQALAALAEIVGHADHCLHESKIYKEQDFTQVRMGTIRNVLCPALVHIYKQTTAGQGILYNIYIYIMHIIYNIYIYIYWGIPSDS